MAFLSVGWLQQPPAWLESQKSGTHSSLPAHYSFLVMCSQNHFACSKAEPFLMTTGSPEEPQVGVLCSALRMEQFSPCSFPVISWSHQWRHVLLSTGVPLWWMLWPMHNTCWMFLLYYYYYYYWTLIGLFYYYLKLFRPHTVTMIKHILCQSFRGKHSLGVVLSQNVLVNFHTTPDPSSHIVR